MSLLRLLVAMFFALRSMKNVIIILLCVTFTSCGKYIVAGKCNGHEYVDLGLPSGTMWATCNVGADNDAFYNFGWLLAWGEVTPKKEYSILTYKFVDGATGLTKYCTDEKLTSIALDNKIQLDLVDDAASSLWGSPWKMPSKEDYNELIKYCKFKRKIRQGYVVYRIKGPNGHVMYMPPSVIFRDKVKSDFAGGAYWSSSIDE